MKNSILKYSFIHALGATAYISLVATIMKNIDQLLGPADGQESVFAPIAFLTLFVISAAVMSLTIFGRPVMWYLDGKKKEAIRLVFQIIGFLFLFLLIVVLYLVNYYQ